MGWITIKLLWDGLSNMGVKIQSCVIMISQSLNKEYFEEN